MSIASIDLNLLLALHAVLEERNVARAARRLHVTPSAVSNSLARLRSALGDPLVTRKGRGIVPTPRASELAPVLARAIRELEAGLFARAFDPASCARVFTLAMADAGQLTWLPAIAAAMRRELPRAQLRVVDIDSLVSLGDLMSTEVDVHVGLAGRGAGLHAEPLYDEQTILVARRGHPATQRRRLTPRALGELRHVRVELVPGRGFRDRVADAYARDGVPRVVALAVPSFVAAAAVVARSDLVATLPLSFVEAHGARFGLAQVRGPVPEDTIPIALCWHERTHADRASVAFRDVVRRAIRAPSRPTPARVPWNDPVRDLATVMPPGRR